MNVVKYWFTCGYCSLLDLVIKSSKFSAYSAVYRTSSEKFGRMSGQISIRCDPRWESTSISLLFTITLTNAGRYINFCLGFTYPYCSKFSQSLECRRRDSWHRGRLTFQRTCMLQNSFMPESSNTITISNLSKIIGMNWI